MDSLLSTPTEAAHGALSWLARAIERRTSALTIFLCVLLLLGTMRASVVENRGVEHPGVVHQDDNCSSCHPDKTLGKSVHSAMALSCTVCHLAQTQGDMTILTLPMPKAKICSACHEEGMFLRQHSRVSKGLCLDCHDAHSSNRRMLLRASTNARRNSMRGLSRTQNLTRTTADRP
jgi:predicted CXXCH cytochrome family protein